MTRKSVPAKSEGNWLRTDPLEEAIQSITLASLLCDQVLADIALWKWIIITTHNAAQNTFVRALGGTSGLMPLQDDVAAAWLEAHANGGVYPEEKLDTFMNLFKKVKKTNIAIVSGTQGKSMASLNKWRNAFIHFLPQSWSIEVSGLPLMCSDVLALTRATAINGITWYEKNDRPRYMAAIETLQTKLGALGSTRKKNA